LEPFGDKRSWDLEIPEERLVVLICSRGQVQRGEYYSQIDMLSAFELIHRRHIVEKYDFWAAGATFSLVRNQSMERKTTSYCDSIPVTLD
jgi:hypothetical protein